MSVHLQKEIDQLKAMVSKLGQIVQKNLEVAVEATRNCNGNLAGQVLTNCNPIGDYVVDIEEKCLKIFALHQPVAIDLRFVASVLKINGDLERISDLTASIGKNVLNLKDYPKLRRIYKMGILAERTREALRKCMDAVFNLDIKLAYEVLQEEEQIDTIYREIKGTIYYEMENSPDFSKPHLYLLQISRRLERIADYADRIAKDVLFMVEAEIVRKDHDDLFAAYDENDPMSYW